MKVLMKVLVIILAALCGLTSGTHSEGPGKCLARIYQFSPKARVVRCIFTPQSFQFKSEGTIH